MTALATIFALLPMALGHHRRGRVHLPAAGDRRDRRPGHPRRCSPSCWSRRSTRWSSAPGSGCAAAATPRPPPPPRGPSRSPRPQADRHAVPARRSGGDAAPRPPRTRWPGRGRTRPTLGRREHRQAAHPQRPRHPLRLPGAGPPVVGRAQGGRSNAACGWPCSRPRPTSASPSTRRRDRRLREGRRPGRPGLDRRAGTRHPPRRQGPHRGVQRPRRPPRTCTRA